MDKENRCVCCGAPIPEGSQVCKQCEMACRGCKWRSDGLTMACFSPDSPRYGDYVRADGWCLAWEKREAKR